MSKIIPSPFGITYRGIFLLGLTLLIHTLQAQGDIDIEYYSVLSDWRNGSVQIDGKTILEGRVRYNWLENILTIKTTQGTHTFSASNIQRFDMDDPAGMRHFISSSDGSSTKGTPAYYFFEILSECTRFALMMRERAYASREYQFNEFTNAGAHTTVVGVEKTLYIFDDEGNIKPYMMLTESHRSSWFYSRPKMKRHMINKNLIKDYLADHSNEMTAYVKEHGLSFRKKDDLVKILAYYNELDKKQ